MGYFVKICIRRGCKVLLDLLSIGGVCITNPISAVANGRLDLIKGVVAIFGDRS